MVNQCYLLAILLILAGFLAAAYYFVWFFNSLKGSKSIAGEGQWIMNSDILVAVSIALFLVDLLPWFGLLIVGFILGRQTKKNRSS